MKGLAVCLLSAVVLCGQTSLAVQDSPKVQRDKLIAQQRFAEALPIAEAIVKDLSSGGMTRELGAAQRSLADVLLGLSRLDDAHKQYLASLATLETSGGGATADAASAWHGKGRAEYFKRDFANAETSHRKALDIRQAVSPDSMDCAASLFELGSTAYAQGRLDVAEENYSQSLAIRQKLAPDTLFVAVGQTALGNVVLSKGDLSAADQLYASAQNIFEKLAPASIGASQVMNNRAGVAREKGDLALAQELYSKALVIQERLAPESPEVARTLSNLGAIAWSTGDLETAQSSLDRARAIQERLAPDSLELASTLNNAGALAEQKGDIDGALELYERAVAIQTRNAPGSLSVAATLNNLGALAKDKGDLTMAEEKFQEAMTIRMRVAPDSLDVASSHLALGVVALDRGDLVRAQSRFDQALDIQTRVAPGSLAIAETLNYLGNIAQLRGDLDTAKSRYESALGIKRKLSGESLAVAKSLDDLGAVAWMSGDLAKAEERFRAALDIYEKFSPGSLKVASGHTNLGVIAHGRKQYDIAEEHVRTALDIQQRAAPKSLVLATSLSNLGAIAFDRSDYERAKTLFQSSLEIRKTLAPGSLADLTGMNDLDAALRNLGDLAGSKSLLVERLEGLREFLSRESASGVQSNAARILVNTAIKEIGVHAGKGGAERLYEGLVGLRGLALSMESQQRSATLAARTDPAVRGAQTAFAVALKAQTEWIQNRSKNVSEEQYKTRLLELRTNVDRARRALASVLQLRDPRLAATRAVTLQEIQIALPEDTVLIEFVRVNGYDARLKKDAEEEYGAFVVSRSAPIRWCSLGDAGIIDAGVQDFQELVSQQLDFASGKQLDEVCKSLYSRIIPPLGALPTKIVVVPDAALFQLPFNALMDEKGRYLIETHSVSLLGSGRDLVEGSKGTPKDEAVALGGPQFDLMEAGGTTGGGEDSVSRPVIASGKWPPLAGARTECEDVARSLDGRLIVGAQATEEALEAVSQPSVLHIATHGFFYPPSVGDAATKAVLEGDGIGRGIKTADSPMLRSGLVLAGANDEATLRRSGRADGWGTALELSQLDLRGTELVVLSGCETGRGDYRIGEGVFGLQRAFMFAGAKSLVMSLFKVPDTATKTLFERFYSAWKPGAGKEAKLDALRAAQLAIMRNPATRSPQNWAAFVLMGER